MTKVLHIVGARPNFMKVAPVIRAFAERDVAQTLVHTGQHFDVNMSRVFFEDLELPAPDGNLEVGADSPVQQISLMLSRLEPVVSELRPDWMFVYGDVTSVVAGALVATRLGVPLAHVEAGLRSFDRTMPEELNRVVTDQLADLLFTPSIDGDENLAREGIPASRIRRVGNVMIDTLVRLLPKAESRWSDTWSKDFSGGGYALVTLHRPSNVDDPDDLRLLMDALVQTSRLLPLVFPVHPRTRQRLEDSAVPAGAYLRLMEPLGYLDFLAMQRHAALVITDSGGIQEETSYLGVPCLTVRDNTERPITVTMGTNCVIGRSPAGLFPAVERVLSEARQPPVGIPLWDGRAGARIAECLLHQPVLSSANAL